MSDRNLNSFVAALGAIPYELDPKLVRRKSRDMSLRFSPIMKRQLDDKTADAVVCPRTKAELLHIVATAAKHRIPVLARGAGTCNFGQGIPLEGGIIIDMTALDSICWVDSARVRAQTGARLTSIDKATQAKGWELRMHSSTRRVATIGGFIAGGHAGVGSCAYGILRDRGNILGLEVMSVEESPRLIELRGPDVNLVHHAYGANGIITEVEMPLAPAWAWREAVVGFSDFMNAVRFCHALATADGILKKLISVAGWPLPSMMPPLAPLVPANNHVALSMIAESSLESFESLAAEYEGVILSTCCEGEGPYGLPLYEFSWGHARLQLNKVDPTITDVIGLFPPNDLLGSIERSYNRFRDTGPLQLEAKRFDGALTFQGSPYFPYVDDKHLAWVIRGLEDEGVKVANSNTFLVGEGGMKTLGNADYAFKRAMDPFGLLNPGKFASSASDQAGAALSGSGWTYKS
jgi:hypothetical protein